MECVEYFLFGMYVLHPLKICYSTPKISKMCSLLLAALPPKFDENLDIVVE